MPRVSICIPAYKPDFFEVALKSALAQSFSDTEIIVSDDCPTDAIAQICERYGDAVSYSRNPNPGESTNVMRLAGLANGEYIKYLFDDDVLNPFCVQFLLELLEQTRTLGTKLAFSPRYVIDENNHVKSLLNPFNITGEAKHIPGSHFIRMTAINHANLLGEYSTAMFRTQDCFDEGGEFRLFRLEDGIVKGLLDLSGWIDLARRGDLVAHPHPLSYFRQHGGSLSNHETNPIFIYAITFYEEIMEMAFSEGYLPPKELGMSLTKLIGVYEYWRGAFPELNARIEQLQKKRALLPPM